MRIIDKLFSRYVDDNKMLNKDSQKSSEEITKLREERRTQRKARKSKKSGTIESRMWEDRRDAAESIGNKYCSESQMAQLLTATKDKVIHVRRAAFQALGKVGGGNSVIPLLLDYSKFHTWEMCDNKDLIFETLLKIASRDTVPFIQEGLKHENICVRRCATEILGVCRDSRAVTPLIESLIDNDIASYAATALGIIGDQKAILPLYDCLSGNSDTHLIVKAIQQIKVRHGESENFLSSEMLSSLIKATLTDCDRVALNREFLDAANPGWHKTKEARILFPIFIEALTEGDISVLSVLEKISPEWEKSSEAAGFVEKFIHALKPGNRICNIAPQILGGIGDSIAVPHLVDCVLKDGYCSNKEIYIEALKNIGDKYAINALASLANETPSLPVGWHANHDPSMEYKWSATVVLTELGDHRAIKYLLARLHKFCNVGYWDSLGYPDTDRTTSHINDICELLVIYGSSAILPIKHSLEEYPYDESFLYSYPDKVKDVLQRINKLYNR